MACKEYDRPRTGEVCVVSSYQAGVDPGQEEPCWLRKMRRGGVKLAVDRCFLWHMLPRCFLSFQHRSGERCDDTAGRCTVSSCEYLPHFLLCTTRGDHPLITSGREGGREVTLVMCFQWSFLPNWPICFSNHWNLSRYSIWHPLLPPPCGGECYSQLPWGFLAFTTVVV